MVGCACKPLVEAQGLVTWTDLCASFGSVSVLERDCVFFREVRKEGTVSGGCFWLSCDSLAATQS